MWGRRLIASLIVSAGTVGTALAADDIPPIGSVTRVYDWSGVYGGIIGGYSRGFSSQQGIDVNYSSGNYAIGGMLVGANAGFNYQFGQWVIGLDTELSYARISGSRAPYFSSNLSTILTNRTRIGYSVGEFLPYIGLGPSYGRLSSTETFPGAPQISGSQIRSGWSFAAGVDYLILPNVFARAEYTFICFGTDVFRNAENVLLMGHYLRLGLDYKLDVPGWKREMPNENAPSGRDYNWTGVYLGPSLGGSAVAQHSSLTVNNAPIETVAGSSAGGIVGFGLQGTVGAQAGANWQIGQFVFGAESDFHFSELAGAGTNSDFFFVSAGVPAKLSQSTKIGEMGTVRARFGVAYDRWLVYSTAGLAYAFYQSNLQFSSAAGKTVTAQSESTRIGAIAGLGVERAVWDKWTTRIEYMYANFGSSSYSVNAGAPFNVVSSRANASEHILRVGFNRMFN